MNTACMDKLAAVGCCGRAGRHPSPTTPTGTYSLPHGTQMSGQASAGRGPSCWSATTVLCTVTIKQAGQQRFGASPAMPSCHSTIRAQIIYPAAPYGSSPGVTRTSVKDRPPARVSDGRWWGSKVTRHGGSVTVTAPQAFRIRGRLALRSPSLIESHARGRASEWDARSGAAGRTSRSHSVHHHIVSV